MLATKAGPPLLVCAIPSTVPCADDDSSCSGDIVTSVAGLNVASASHRLASPTDLVTDVTLVHPFNSRHQLKEDFFPDAETRKNLAYKTDYRAQDLAFAGPRWPAIPLVSNVLIPSGDISGSLQVVMPL